MAQVCVRAYKIIKSTTKSSICSRDVWEWRSQDFAERGKDQGPQFVDKQSDKRVQQARQPLFGSLSLSLSLSELLSGNNLFFCSFYDFKRQLKQWTTKSAMFAI